VTAAEGQFDGQLDAALALARRGLGEGLVAACLYGSATHGGLRRWSDIDLLIAVRHPPPEAVLRALALGWLPFSGQPGDALRPLEATVLALSDLRPWRWPPRRLLQFGEWLRPDLERGIVEPPQPDPDLALLVTQARANGRPLLGPPPAEVFEPVPPGDLRRALAESLPCLLAGWREDCRNALLTLARMWLTAATGRFEPKDRAADWAIARLPSDAAPWLARARDDYLGRADADWTETDAVVPLVDRLTAEIEAALAGPGA
jgi:streptomycin 3"-adenylyltransferase